MDYTYFCCSKKWGAGPKEWTENQKRCRETGIPEERLFMTKPQLAKQMLQRVISSSIPFKWITADSLYGDDRRLRLWLEERECSYVMAGLGEGIRLVGVPTVPY